MIYLVNLCHECGMKIEYLPRLENDFQLFPKVESNAEEKVKYHHTCLFNVGVFEQFIGSQC